VTKKSHAYNDFLYQTRYNTSCRNVNHFMVNLEMELWNTVKRLLRHVNGVRFCKRFA